MTAYGKYYVNSRSLHHGQHLSRGLGEELVNMLYLGETSQVSEHHLLKMVWKGGHAFIPDYTQHPLLTQFPFARTHDTLAGKLQILDGSDEQIAVVTFVSIGMRGAQFLEGKDQINGEELKPGESQQLQAGESLIVIVSMMTREIGRLCKNY